MRHFGNRSHAVDRAQHALKLIIGSERRRLVAISQDAPAQHIRIVVRTQGCPLSPGLSDPLLDPLEQAPLINFEVDHRVELEAPLLEQAIEGVGLRNGAREAVEDEAVARIGLGNSVGNNGDDKSMSPVESCTMPCLATSRSA